MANYATAISGIEVAQRALDLIGTNLANATTKGYHRQDLVTSPIQVGSGLNFAGGVKITSVRRSIDVLMEREIMLQQPHLGQNAQELSTLRLVENAIGDLDTQGLVHAMDTYFNALQELASQPNSQPLRYQAVWAADGMADQFRHMGRFLDDLERQIALESENIAEQVNQYTLQISTLNQQIESIVGRGANANVLLDQRDRAVLELGNLVEIEVYGLGAISGMVDVYGMGLPLTVGGDSARIETGIRPDEELGVAIEGSRTYDSSPRGGVLGGLLSLKNELIPAIHDELNALAKEIITKTNKIHVQGLGDFGSFTDLTGWPILDDKLSDWSDWGTTIQAGEVNVRITNQQTGALTLHQIVIDGNSTGDTIAQDLDALAELKADVTGGALHIESADTSLYKFDFLPATALDLTSSPWTGTASPTVTGLYNGQTKQTFTLEVLGGAPGDTVQVGVTNGVELEVRNGSGELVKTVGAGLGYAAGDSLDIGNGLRLSLPAGTMKVGEQFSIDVTNQSDSSGILAAMGINAFFSGSTAEDMTVRAELLNDPKRLATGLTPEISDNINVRTLANIGETELAQLLDLTPSDYLRRIVAGLGQDISFRQARQSSLEGAMAQMENAREQASGVDVNEEAAKMIVFEKMFQAIAKFMQTQNKALEYLMNTL